MMGPWTTLVLCVGAILAAGACAMYDDWRHGLYAKAADAPRATVDAPFDGAA